MPPPTINSWVLVFPLPSPPRAATARLALTRRSTQSPLLSSPPAPRPPCRYGPVPHPSTFRRRPRYSASPHRRRSPPPSLFVIWSRSCTSPSPVGRVAVLNGYLLMDGGSETSSESKISCVRCGKTANLQCPKCVELKLPREGATFCSQECFKASWNSHKSIHSKLKPSADDTHNNDTKSLDGWLYCTKKGRSRTSTLPYFDWTGPLRPFPISKRRLVPDSIEKPDWAIDMISSTLLLYTMRRLKLISFREPRTTSDSPSASASLVPLRTLIQTSPVSLTYLLYMLASMESVRGVNVPMYTTLRRTTVVITMIVEYFLTGQRYSLSVIGSVAIIVFGAFVAGARDLSYDTYGYAIVLLANLTTAIYLATIARIGKSSGLNSFGLMWCNGLICGPVLLFWTYVQGDLGRTANFPYLFSPGFMAVMSLSCIVAFFLNYSIFLNTTLNSAVTQTMCGNLKDFFTVGLGWAIFGGLPFDLLNVVGQALGFLGSGFYAYCKIKGK